MTQITESGKRDCSMYPIAFADAEWSNFRRLHIQDVIENHAGQPRPFFTDKQITFCNDKYQPKLTIILWDERYPMPSETAFERTNEEIKTRLALHRLPSDHELIVVSCDAENTTIFDIAKLSHKLKLVIFSSPKDVEAVIGRNSWKELLVPSDRTPSPISKTRNIQGCFGLNGTQFCIKDLFGAFNTSLEKALHSVGVTPMGKTLQNNWYEKFEDIKSWTKGRMDIWKHRDPDTYLNYIVGDTIDLAIGFHERLRQVNRIITEALGEDMPQFTLDTMPCSSGSLVDKTFINWLRTRHPALFRAVMMLSDSNDSRAWGRLKKLTAELMSDDADLEKIHRQIQFTEEVEDSNGKPMNSSIVHGLGMCSIRNYPLLTQNTGLFGAVVQGGRCTNEEPKENPYNQYLEDVLDTDMASCYGSEVAKTFYPFGIPTIWENGKDDDPLTLGEVLSKIGDELVDGLATIYVEGRLPFDDDLIYSKYNLSTQKILKTIISGAFEQETETELWGREVEVAHLGGDFLLTRNEKQLGIITPYMLKVLRAVTRNEEWSAINQLKVQAVVYFPKSLELTHQDWIDTITNPQTRGKKTRNGDMRTRKWTRVSMQEFVGRFVDYRGEVKSRMKALPDGDERLEVNLLQNGVKLFVNTVYGNFAAPYFAMGNTVLANNITAKARIGAWMMSKALLTVQSITDGGMFSNRRVAFLKSGEKKPGLHTLANRERLLSHRTIRTGWLYEGDVCAWMNKDTRKKADEQALDKLVLDHLNTFWGHYGLEFPFNIECKYDHTGKFAVYFGSSDYAIAGVQGRGSDFELVNGLWVLLKVRGANQDEHPKKGIMRHLLFPFDIPVPDPNFDFNQRIGLKEYQKNPVDDLLPDEDKVRKTKHRPYSAGRYFADWAEKKKFEDAKSKAVRRDKEPNKHFGVAKALIDGVYKPIGRLSQWAKKAA